MSEPTNDHRQVQQDREMTDYIRCDDTGITISRQGRTAEAWSRFKVRFTVIDLQAAGMWPNGTHTVSGRSPPWWSVCPAPWWCNGAPGRTSTWWCATTSPCVAAGAGHPRPAH